MIYTVAIMLVAVLSYATAGRPTIRQRVYFATLIIVAFATAFRFDVGCDWPGYYFQWIKSLELGSENLLGGRDGGWAATLGLVQALGLDYPVLNVVTAVIFFIGAHRFAKTQPDRLGYLFFLLPVLVVNMPMSALRQAAAIGFIFWALIAFIEHRTVRYVVFVVVASLFHSSAVIFILLAPLVNGRLSHQRLAMVGLLAIPALVLIATSEAADVATTRYLETDREAFGAVFRLAFLGLGSLLFFVFLRRPWREQSYADYRLALIGSIAAFALIPAIFASTIIADRLGYYLIPIQAMIFARIPFIEGLRNRNLLRDLAVVGSLTFFFVWALTSSHFERCYLPYQTWILGYPEPIEESLSLE